MNVRILSNNVFKSKCWFVRDVICKILQDKTSLRPRKC